MTIDELIKELEFETHISNKGFRDYHIELSMRIALATLKAHKQGYVFGSVKVSNFPSVNMITREYNPVQNELEEILNKLGE